MVGRRYGYDYDIGEDAYLLYRLGKVPGQMNVCNGDWQRRGSLTHSLTPSASPASCAGLCWTGLIARLVVGSRDPLVPG